MRKRTSSGFFIILFLFSVGGSKAASDCYECISINEFQFAPQEGPNGDNSVTGEFLELYNRCNDTVEIGCMQLCMFTGSFCGECVQIPSGTQLGPGEVFTMGGYGTNCSGGGVTACDHPGLNLDLNWHDCGCVNDPDAGISCSSSNSGMFWGVLVDGGEDIYLFDPDDDLVQGITYGAGGGYSDGDCTAGGTVSMNGCSGCSGSTVDPPSSGSLPNIGGSGGTIGFQNDCSGSFTEISDTANFTPGSADCSSLIDPPCCTVRSGFDVGDSSQCVAQDSFSFQNTGSTGPAVEYEYRYGDGGIDSLEDPNHSYSDTGVYRVRQIVDSNDACRDTSFMTVVVGTVGVSVLPPDTLNCSVDSVLLDGSTSSTWPGSVSYSWSSSGGSILSGGNDDSAWGGAAASYQLTVTDDSMNCSKDTSVTVELDTLSPTPSISPPDTFQCTTDSLILDATGSSTRSGKKDFSWSALSGVIEKGANSDTPQIGSSGDYALTVTDPENACVSEDTVTVPADQGIPTVNLSQPDTLNCDRTTVRVDASGSTTNSGTIGFAWSNASGNIVGAAGDSSWIDVDRSGSYILTVTDPASGCKSSRSVFVPIDTASPDPQVAAPDTLTCSRNPLRVDAGASTTHSGSKLFEWSTTNGDIIAAASDSSWIEVDESASYTVSVEDVENGCKADTTVTVKLNPLPDVAIGGTDLKGCSPVNAKLVNETPDSLVGSDCVWDFGDGEEAAGCDSISHVYDEPGCYDVTLTVSSPEGCVDSATMTDYVCVRPSPEADFKSRPGKGSVMDPGIEFSNLSTGAVAYEWDFGGLDSSRKEDPSYEFPDEGEGSYDVCLSAMSAYGCVDSTCKEVRIDGAFTLYVPNAFTPDGDGRNDHFKPVLRGADPDDYSLSIYDRWGEVVFQTQDPEAEWDGSVKGSQSIAKADVYVWRVVTINEYTGRRVEEKGHVTLIR